jgi:hypothetical protein
MFLDGKALGSALHSNRERIGISSGEASASSIGFACASAV